MPIISKVGTRSWRMRALYAAIFAVLILGAVTMVYPFLLMLAGSVKSEADSADISPYPRFWFDDTVLFQKYVESKYNVRVQTAEAAWWEPATGWRSIQPPTKDGMEFLDDFLEWRDTCPWWTLGHTGGARLLPINARLFRHVMYDRFHGDLDSFCREMELPVKSWSAVIPPPYPAGRYPAQRDGYMGAFNDFARTRPIQDRIIPNLDGEYWRNFLEPRYTSDIAQYNHSHGTQYASYRDIFLPTRAPAAGLPRKDWEEYVRKDLKLEFLRLDSSLAGSYRRFLSQSVYSSIDELNRRYRTAYRSFDEIPFPTTVPADRIAQVDWEKFVRDPQACPLEAIEIYGPRQAFEEFVAQRHGVPVEKIAPLRLPIPQADYHDTLAHAGELRWEFSTRNYKDVFEYVVLHGRGIINTLIYCLLAIGSAVVVNPLAAYALSRYKLPHTYKILLFCMATMAFPAEVTVIPVFLLLKRFPLWPLAGGAASFFAAFWLAKKLLPRLVETIQMTLALSVGLLVGGWLIPVLIYKPTVSLLNTFAALVLPNMANGFFIFLLKGFFDSLPPELYESAEIDGANEWIKFWHITMSLSKPILAVIALTAFTQAYSAFMMALIIIPDSRMWTLMVWIYQLQSQSHLAVVYASLVIAAIPTFVVFTLC
jgi:ABC-type glycerol-3-phosphate transport system permease component